MLITLKNSYESYSNFYHFDVVDYFENVPTSCFFVQINLLCLCEICFSFYRISVQKFFWVLSEMDAVMYYSGAHIMNTAAPCNHWFE